MEMENQKCFPREGKGYNLTSFGKKAVWNICLVSLQQGHKNFCCMSPVLSLHHRGVNQPTQVDWLSSQPRLTGWVYLSSSRTRHVLLLLWRVGSLTLSFDHGLLGELVACEVHCSERSDPEEARDRTLEEPEGPLVSEDGEDYQLHGDWRAWRGSHHPGLHHIEGGGDNCCKPSRQCSNCYSFPWFQLSAQDMLCRLQNHGHDDWLDTFNLGKILQMKQMWLNFRPLTTEVTELDVNYISTSDN